MSDSIEGFVNNIQPLGEEGGFAFDIQGDASSTRIVCFTPQKRKQIDDLLKSPVKIAKLKTPTRGDLQLQGSSEITPTKLQF